MTKFNWNNFDEDFLRSIVFSSRNGEENRPISQDCEKEFLLPYMSSICNFPNDKFVKDYRTVIERNLFKNHPEHINAIAKNLKISGENHLTLLNKLCSMKTTATLCKVYCYVLAQIGGYDCVYTDFSKFTSRICIDIQKSIAQDIPLYDFQKDAVASLTKHFIEQDKSSGLLVMPTGSGKTRTAVSFLLKKMVSQGHQVVWLTHRHMLIDQTAENFYDFAPLVKLENPDIKNYNMICVSGMHQSIKATDKSDTVLIISVQSVCRSLDYLRAVLAKKVIIVVDEAHHTLARSYQNTINTIRKYRKNTKLLGLTATPVRATESGSKHLIKLFENNIVYNVSMSDLICKGILATPKFERVETGEDFEPVISLDEREFINKFGEIPETLVNKIALSCARNKVIVSQYINKKNIYGKTLIFALNIIHCRTLYEDLCKQGVRCDYIHSGRDENNEIIRRFREGELDVLINVNIMTEGSDVPGIETIFLTRPTQSDGLLMQMIGRGMRGKQAGGTEDVRIVDFCDKWDIFNKWLNPEWLIQTEINPPEAEFTGQFTGNRYTSVIDWELCHEIYKSLEYSHNPVKSYIALPVCWYALIDQDGNDYRMLVFDDQLKGFLNLYKDKKQILVQQSIDVESIINKYFDGFCIKPLKRDIEIFIDNLRDEDNPPQRFILENRKAIDPAYVCQQIEKEGLNPLTLAKTIYDKNPMVKNIYGCLQNYTMKLCEYSIYKNNIHPAGMKVEELPLESIPFRMESVYDLDELVNEVKNEMFGGCYDGISYFAWTDKPYKTYYGMYYYNDNHIMINCILNSPDVPRETVKFIIYHEMLHRDYAYHNKEFYIEEHKYPNYTEHERFLNNQMLKFDVSIW